MIVKRMLEINGFSTVGVTEAVKGRNKIIAVGSVVHQAVDGDVIWGAGVNGKSWPRNLNQLDNLSISLVRGPLTRDVIKSFKHDCPENYGDPGLLFKSLFKEEINKAAENMLETSFSDVLFIPNLNDDRFLDQSFAKSLSGVKYVSPRHSPFEIAALISKAKLVISSSLH